MCVYVILEAKLEMLILSRMAFVFLMLCCDHEQEMRKRLEKKNIIVRLQLQRKRTKTVHEKVFEIDI